MREDRPSPQTYKLAEEELRGYEERRAGEGRDWTGTGDWRSTSPQAGSQRNAGCGRRRIQRERGGGRRWRQSRSCGGAPGRREDRALRTVLAVRTGKWPHPLPSASTPFENPELKGTPGISGPSGIPPLTPTSSLPSGLKHTRVPKRLPHTFRRFCQSLPSCPFLEPPYLFSPSDPGG